MPDPLQNLRQHLEPLAAVSALHLCAQTRAALSEGMLSIATYPNEYGGFVYVGPRDENAPTEPDLAVVLELAVRAGVVWLKFDCDAPIVDGLTVYPDDEEGL